MSIAKRQRGTSGGPLAVYTNSFEIKTLPKKRFYQYDGISPEPRHPRQAQEIVDRLQTQTAPNIFQPNGVYDGKNIFYVSHLLKFQGNAQTFSVSMSDRPPRPGVPPRGVYAIQLTHTSADTIDFSDLHAYINGKTGAPSSRTLTAINLLQLLIRAAPNLMYPHNLRAYFSDIGKQKISLGLELWAGYFQSVRPSMGRILINVDISMTAMYESGPLREVAMHAIGDRNARALELSEGHANFRKLKSFLKNVRVEVPGGAPAGKKKVKKITGLVPAAGHYVFECDGHPKTVNRHFEEAHQYKIRFPEAVGINVGRKESRTIFPMEVCFIIPGQLYKRKVPQAVTKDVVKFATKKPGDRLAAIANAPRDGAMRAPVFEYANSRFISDAGMVVKTEPVTIKGRVLPTPQVVYANDSAASIRDGAWNVVKLQFREPKSMVAWAVVNFSPRDKENVRAFISEMKNCLSQLRMRHLQPYELLEANGQGNIAQILQQVSRAAVGNAIEQIQSIPPNARPPPPQRPELIVCVLPFPADDIRRAVKHFGDVSHGITTQCLRADKLKPGRGLNQYCNNVALKVNIRLGGETSKTSSRALSELQKQPFMIVGADVGHPGPGSNQPSIAGLVWSYDYHAMRYAAFSRVQAPRQEHIEDLQAMMEAALIGFGAKQPPPARIVFYRDGLSEGEFEGVGKHEIQAIQSAIDVVWERKGAKNIKKPLITYIIIGKRHHVRFFPQPGGGDRSGNCPAGFVADEGIDSPIAADFFLLSHGGLLGTSRPSHYTVLRDDIYGNNPDALQNLSFTLCHCYAKATRSVSIPAPVYYADLVCERAKFHFDPNLGFDAEGTVTSGDGNPMMDLTPWKQGYKPLHPAMQKSMYFL